MHSNVFSDLMMDFQELFAIVKSRFYCSFKYYATVQHNSSNEFFGSLPFSGETSSEYTAEY